MTSKIVRRIVVFSLLTFLMALGLFAQDPSALIGKWNMSSESDSGAVEWTLVLRDADGKLMGFLATEGPEAPAKNFTYADGVIKFIAPYQGDDYTIELKMQGDKLVGTWSGGGNDGKTTGAKAKS